MLFEKRAKPFLKWAGGKTQLIKDIKKLLPDFVYEEEFTYIEPFVGSGAFMFWMQSNFPNIKEVIINDINSDLTNTYKTIQEKPKRLISLLKSFENEYHQLNQEERRKYYNSKRKLFNSRNEHTLLQSALLIFLNKTCFNGLYRVNKKNEFNVPIGSYVKPIICDEENILLASKKLKNVKILNGDFELTMNYISNKTVFYFDPPYKPINKTSSFTSYANGTFDDKEQIRLRNFCKKLDLMGASWILSNSDLKNINNNDNFFDDLYKDFNIRRVKARRAINSVGNKRGQLKELLIGNYDIGLNSNYNRNLDVNK